MGTQIWVNIGLDNGLKNTVMQLLPLLSGAMALCVIHYYTIYDAIWHESPQSVEKISDVGVIDVIEI